MMNDEQLLRYSRHILLQDIDIEGQAKLLQSSVLIIGLGGLGCPVALYLAASGVGKLVLADFDDVDLSNLQRQIAHGTSAIGQAKVHSAVEAIARLNPDVATLCLTSRLEGQALLEAVAQVDVVVDCCDNFATRFAVNQACVAMRKPLVSGAAIRLEGQVVVFDAREPESPCYRCLYDVGDDEQLSCAESGVLAPLVGVIGSVQALETLKLLVGFGQPLVGRLLILDAKTLRWQELRLVKDAHCPVCSLSSSPDSDVAQ